MIGAGPSGFYAAAALLEQATVTVNIRPADCAAWIGALRRGANHQNIKAVAKTYDRTAVEPNFRYFGNVGIGKDLTHAD